jgi:hypothetical protein
LLKLSLSTNIKIPVCVVACTSAAQWLYITLPASSALSTLLALTFFTEYVDVV